MVLKIRYLAHPADSSLVYIHLMAEITFLHHLFQLSLPIQTGQVIMVEMKHGKPDPHLDQHMQGWGERYKLVQTLVQKVKVLILGAEKMHSGVTHIMLPFRDSLPTHSNGLVAYR